MTDKTKPISASNPPESRGMRPARDEEPMTRTGKDTANEEEGTMVVDQPTQTAPSPAKKSTKQTSTK